MTTISPLVSEVSTHKAHLGLLFFALDNRPTAAVEMSRVPSGVSMIHQRSDKRRSHQRSRIAPGEHGNVVERLTEGEEERGMDASNTELGDIRRVLVRVAARSGSRSHVASKLAALQRLPPTMALQCALCSTHLGPAGSWLTCIAIRRLPSQLKSDCPQEKATVTFKAQAVLEHLIRRRGAGLHN